jgi:hypothetical protein
VLSEAEFPEKWGSWFPYALTQVREVTEKATFQAQVRDNRQFHGGSKWSKLPKRIVTGTLLARKPLTVVSGGVLRAPFITAAQ